MSNTSTAAVNIPTPEPPAFHRPYIDRCGPDINATRAAPVALAMLCAGYPVSPAFEMRRNLQGNLICACGGRLNCAEGKHPRNKFTTRAATDLDAFFGFNRRYPRANWIISTGDGLVVIDIDSRGGEEAKQGLEAVHGELPETWEARSGREGFSRHLYFSTARDAYVPNAQKLTGADIDVRGHHGYVVLPGSLHKSGRRYAWTRSPSEHALTELPEPWVQFLSKPRPGDTATVKPRGRRTRLRIAAGGEAPVGEARYRFGDGDGLGGFNTPLYMNALQYFGMCGVNADAAALAVSLRKLIKLAPKRPDRSVDRYLSPYMEERIEAARAYIAGAQDTVAILEAA